MRDDTARITPAIGRALKALLDDPSSSRYGFELMQLTGMSSGSLYPALAKLERFGWVDRQREAVDPHDAGRPARYYYRLTAEGMDIGLRALTEFSQQFRPSWGLLA